MKLLDKVQSRPEAKPRRVMLYGVHGVGKSTLAALTPAPIFIQTEDGLGEIDCARFPLAATYDEIVQAIGELYNEKHDYKTVVIDTLDWLERLVWSDVCREKNVKSIEDIGYAKGYTFALYQWRTILSGLDALRNERDMTILLLAHCKVERFEHPETDPFDRWAPRLHKHASAMIQEWCSEVLFASYKVHTKSTDNGFNRKRVQGIGTGERIVRTQERPAHVAKNRLGLPLEVPLTWKAITTNHQNHATE